MTHIIVSILHYKSSKDTLECLKSLLKLNLEGIRLSTYVLDNASPEKLEVDVNKFQEINLTVLNSKINTGFTGGHNLIYEKTQDIDYDFFLLLNNDCLLSIDSVKQLINGVGDSKIGAVVPKIYFTPGHEFHKERYSDDEKGKVFWYAGGKLDWDNVQSKHIGVDEVDRGQYDAKCEIDFATGACLLINKSTLRKVGLFDERYFLYYEDADLSQKIIRAGFKILYNPSSFIWHNNAGSSGSGSTLHDYYLTRNRMLFGMRYAPLRTKVALIRESIRLLTSGRVWQKKGIKDFYLRKFGKGTYNA